jgi:hypothetical protein
MPDDSDSAAGSPPLRPGGMHGGGMDGCLVQPERRPHPMQERRSHMAEALVGGEQGEECRGARGDVASDGTGHPDASVRDREIACPETASRHTCGRRLPDSERAEKQFGRQRSWGSHAAMLPHPRRRRFQFSTARRDDPPCRNSAVLSSTERHLGGGVSTRRVISANVRRGERAETSRVETRHGGARGSEARSRQETDAIET